MAYILAKVSFLLILSRQTVSNNGSSIYYILW